MANFGRQLDSLNKLKELLTKAEENAMIKYKLSKTKNNN